MQQSEKVVKIHKKKPEGRIKSTEAINLEYKKRSKGDKVIKRREKFEWQFALKSSGS